MASYDTNRLNTSLLEQYCSNFKGEKNSYTNAYNTFNSSYLNSCSDSYVQNISNKIRDKYNTLKKGYENIDSWWTNYNSGVKSLENKLEKDNINTEISSQSSDINANANQLSPELLAMFPFVADFAPEMQTDLQKYMNAQKENIESYKKDLDLLQSLQALQLGYKCDKNSYHIIEVNEDFFNGYSGKEALAVLGITSEKDLIDKCQGLNDKIANYNSLIFQAKEEMRLRPYEYLSKFSDYGEKSKAIYNDSANSANDYNELASAVEYARDAGLDKLSYDQKNSVINGLSVARSNPDLNVILYEEGLSSIYGNAQQQTRIDFTFDNVLDEEYGLKIQGVNNIKQLDSIVSYGLIASYITNEQASNYNYLFNKYGKDTAEKYLVSIRNDTNQSIGYDKAIQDLASIKDKNQLEQHASMLLGGAKENLVELVDGVKNAISADGVISVEQYQKMALLNLLGSVSSLKVTDDIESAIVAPIVGPTIENSTENILSNFTDNAASLAFTYKLGGGISNAAVMVGLGSINPGLSFALGGVSSYGNSKNYAYSKGIYGLDAQGYALSAALPDAVLDYLYPTATGLKGTAKIFGSAFAQNLVSAKAGELFLGDSYVPAEVFNESLESGVIAIISSATVNGGVATIKYGGKYIYLGLGKINSLLKSGGSEAVIDYVKIESESSDLETTLKIPIKNIDNPELRIDRLIKDGNIKEAAKEVGLLYGPMMADNFERSYNAFKGAYIKASNISGVEMLPVVDIPLVDLIKIVSDPNEYSAFINCDKNYKSGTFRQYSNALRDLNSYLSIISKTHNITVFSPEETSRIRSILARNFSEYLVMEQKVKLLKDTYSKIPMKQIEIDGIKYIFPDILIDEHLLAKDLIIQKIKNNMSVLPPIVKEQIKQIKLFSWDNPEDIYWAMAYGIDNFYSSATGGYGEIDFYDAFNRLSNIHDARFSFQIKHEAGHNLDMYLGSKVKSKYFSTTAEWKNAMESDYKHINLLSPTKYGTSSNAEDFAESLAIFLVSPEGFATDFPARATLLKNAINNYK